MTDLKTRIYEWLPARRSKIRQSIPTVCAVALEESDEAVFAAWAEMVRDGHIFRDKSGFHRGIPLPSPTPETKETPLW